MKAATARRGAAAPREGPGVARAAPSLLDVLHLPAEMIRRIDQRAQEARALISGEVDRGAVVRAAVAAWFVDAKERPADILHQAIRASLQAEPSLKQLPQYWPPEMAARLSQLATTTARALGREVTRSAVIRAALAFWLDAAEERPASIVACAIEAAIVKRGGGDRIQPRGIGGRRAKKSTDP